MKNSIFSLRPLARPLLALSSIVLLGGLGCEQANAATVLTSILGAPTTISATSFHSAPFVPTTLADGSAPLLSDIGTNRSGGGEWAVANTSAANAHYIVYDMGSTVSLTSFLYSQRTNGAPTDINQNWTSVDVWASDTDPGTVNLATLLAADATRAGHVTLTPITLLTLAAGQNLTQYDLTENGAAVSGRYVTFKFMTTGGNANPGGEDLWLAVPEPSVALLGGLGMLGLLRRRRSTYVSDC